MNITFQNPIELTDAELDAVSGGKKVVKIAKGGDGGDGGDGIGGTVTIIVKGANKGGVDIGGSVSADGIGGAGGAGGGATVC
jgi:hypothetical protein